MRFKPAAPARDRFHFLAQRVPEAHASRRRKPFQREALVADDSAVMPDASSLFRTLAEMPDQPPTELRDQRMIKVSLAPLVIFPFPLGHQQALDPSPLRGQHLLNILKGALERLQLARVFLLHL